MSHQNSERPQLSALVTAMLIIMPTIIWGLVIFIFSQQEKLSGASYYESLISVEDHEYASPAMFLKSDGNYWKTLFGRKYRIEGSIRNTATTAVYKDAVIEFSFYSRTKTKIENTRIVIYDVFPPGMVKGFDIKVEAPKATDTIGWEIVDAARN